MADEHERQALRPAPHGVLSIKLPDEIARLKRSHEWQSGDRHGISLVKDDALNILLMGLKSGAHLHEHRTKGPVVVHLLSGAIRFTAGSEQRTLAAGELVALDREVPHSLAALEESTLLLVTAIA